MSKKKSIPVDPEEMKAIGNTIREARTEKGMKQPELAEKVGVTTQTVSNWENGKYLPDNTNVPELASALDLDPIFLTPIGQNKLEREWKEAWRNHQKMISKHKRILKRILPEYAECFGVAVTYQEDGSALFTWEGHEVTVEDCWNKLYPIVGDVFKDLILQYGEDIGYIAKYGEKKGGSDNGKHN